MFVEDKKFIMLFNYIKRRSLAITFLLTIALFLLLMLILLNKTFYFAITQHFIGKDVRKNAIVTRDIKYCKTQNPSQEYDIFIPRHRPFGDAPVVVNVHGGGWRWGNRINGIEEHYAGEFTSRGIAFVSIDYRLADEAVYPSQNEDVHCALEHIRANEEKYNIDTRNIVIMGDSAGGHLAAMEALIPETKNEVDGVVMLYGVSDLWNQITNYKDINAIHYLGAKNEALAKQASPMYADLNNAPPFLLIHGTSDSIVPASDSEKFTNKLKQNNNSAIFMPVNGAEHAFVGGNDYHEKQIHERLLNYVVNKLY